MSFPGMVCPKKIGEREYMDGGYVNNIPSNIFDHYYDDQVLVVGFENENMKKLVYSENPVFSKGSLKDKILSKLGKAFSKSESNKIENTAYNQIMYDRLYSQNRNNIISLEIGGLSASSFILASKKFEELNYKSYEKTVYFLTKKHANRGYVQTNAS